MRYEKYKGDTNHENSDRSNIVKLTLLFRKKSGKIKKGSLQTAAMSYAKYKGDTIVGRQKVCKKSVKKKVFGLSKRVILNEISRCINGLY